MTVSRRDILRTGLGAGAGILSFATLGGGARQLTAQETDGAVSAEGKHLRLLTFTGPGTHPAFTQEILTAWAQENGATLDSVTVPFGQLSNKIMTTIVAQDSSIDMFYIDSGAFPLIAGGLEPLDPYIERDGLDLSQIGEQLIGLYTLDGQRYCIPHESDTPFLVYRSDLFDSAAEQEAFRAEAGRDLVPPTTFEELLEVAQFFTRSAGETLNEATLENDFYGCALSGRTYISTSRQWEMFLFGFGGTVLDEELRPVFNNEAGHDATAFYTDMALKWGVTQPSIASDGAPEVGVLMNEGRAAMAVIYPSGIPKEPVPGATFNAVPWYSAIEKAWGIAINRYSQNKDIVWEMIKHLSEADTQLQFGQMGAEPTRSDVLANPELVEQRPLLNALVEVHERSRPQTQIPEIGFIWDLESQPIGDIIANGMSVQDALDKTVAQISDVLTNAGYYA
jgi:multiple sugar transport system substrate-binding protein